MQNLNVEQNLKDERTEFGQPTANPAAAAAPVDGLAGNAVYALDAEIRAVEEGHVARVLPDGSVLVKAESHPGNYRVRIRRVTNGVVGFSCTCVSGSYRGGRLPVPCKHAALAGRRLEREGLARWRNGVWLLRERAALRTALAATIRPATIPEPHDLQPPRDRDGSTAVATAA